MKSNNILNFLLIKAFFVFAIYALPLNAQKKPENKNNNPGTGKFSAGVRLGDPTGITVKAYGAKAAVEFNIGRSYYLYKNDYKNGFYRHPKFGDKGIYRYDRYEPYAPLTMQLHILKHLPIKELKGLSWYIGAGPQFRYERVHYWYDYYEGGKWVSRNEVYNDIDLGVDITGGLEYTITEIPLSFFLDATLFMEVFDESFYPWAQGGTGVRYNF